MLVLLTLEHSLFKRSAARPCDVFYLSDLSDLFTFSDYIRMVDLLALACQEVGIDMVEDMEEEKCDSEEWMVQSPVDERCWPSNYKEL